MARPCALLAAVLLGLALPPVASAAPVAISGTLSAKGYTVIAVASSGRATAKVATRGTFSLRPPATLVTLHLRKPNGKYAGPVVLGSRRDGRRAVLGVRAGAKLGKISVNTKKGYAKVSSPPGPAVDDDRQARARHGVPIGARVYGRVRARPLSDTPGDRDLDGIVDPLDVDDDGDLILDNLERRAGARAAAKLPGFTQELQLTNVLPLTLNGAANANAGTTTAESDAMLAQLGYLILSEIDGDTAELDCGQLPYCRTGGTGTVFGTDPPLKFPECCDADRDGMGTFARNPSLPSPTAGMFLHHGATSAEMKTGDVLIERVTRKGAETAYPATLQYVFATVPALRAWSDTAAAPHAGTVTYPVPSNAPGSAGSGFPVSAGTGGDVVLRLELWRPQRRRIPEEAGAGDWTDIGRLTYVVAPQAPGAGGRFCAQDGFSEPGGGLAVPATPDPRFIGGGLIDQEPDRPANPDNVMRFTVNVTRCLAGLGITWAPGQEIGLGLRALAGGSNDAASQTVFFRREG